MDLDRWVRSTASPPNRNAAHSGASELLSLLSAELCPAHLRVIRTSGSACVSGPPARLGESASNEPMPSGSSGRPDALTCESKLACTETRQARFRTSAFAQPPSPPNKNAARGGVNETSEYADSGIVSGSPYGDPDIRKRMRFRTANTLGRVGVQRANAEW